MEQNLKDIIVRHIEKVGERAAIKSASENIDTLVKVLDEEGVPSDDVLSAIAFKMKLIEYLYFHNDVEERALKLAKTLK